MATNRDRTNYDPNVQNEVVIIDPAPVPIPSVMREWKRPGLVRGRPKRQYPFNKLQVGESFTGPPKAQAAATRHKARCPGWDFTSRKVSAERIRIWRTA